jgi:glycosyltransferase involved in cell wall biosynthesis
VGADVASTLFVSILTPSYNYARYLPDALRSVALQETEREVEHVVVDDGSSDDSVALLEAWSDHPLVLRVKENEGQSATLNAALALAGGEWIGWLNADDFYLPGALAEVERAASDDVDVIHGDAVYVDAEGRVLRFVPQHPMNVRTLRRYGTSMCPSSVFMRREILPDEPWDRNFRLLLDWNLWLTLAHRGARFTYVPWAFSAFRWHEQQVSQNPTPGLEDEFATMSRRFGVARPSHISRMPRLDGMVEHGVLKLRSRSYRRQWRIARELKGADMRWFDGPDALGRTERLLELADARTGSRGASPAVSAAAN